MNLVGLMVLSLADCTSNKPFDYAGHQIQLKLNKEVGDFEGYYLVNGIVDQQTQELYVCDDTPLNSDNDWTKTPRLNSRISKAMCTDAGYDCSQPGDCKAILTEETNNNPKWSQFVDDARDAKKPGTLFWINRINCPINATTLADCDEPFQEYPEKLPFISNTYASCYAEEAIMLNCGNTCFGSNTTEKTKKTISTGTIIGIAVGSLAVVIGALAVYMNRNKSIKMTLL